MSGLKDTDASTGPSKTTLSRLAQSYQQALLEDVMPFWEKYSVDRPYGGYFTCLDRQGNVFDTDKFIWLQGRQVWMLSTLYNRVEKRDEWIEQAELGIRFLADHGRNEEGDWYFSLDREGVPLVQPFSIFSDCFAAMAFSEFAKATDNDEAAAVAKNTYERILSRQSNPRGIYNKNVAGGRPLTGLALPMILSNLTVELSWLLGEHRADKTCRSLAETLLNKFRDPKLGVLHESVTPDGGLVDSFEGRVCIPGHGIEAMWFVMEIAERFGDAEMVDRAVDVTISSLEFGWDSRFDGIFYFLDTKGLPPEQLEWDQKLWWVHLETMVSLLMGYRLTGRSECWTWFEKVHAYTWGHFPDPEFGEWFGYLDRRGDVLLPLKGGKWKGCFHVPRGLYRCMLELDALAETS